MKKNFETQFNKLNKCNNNLVEKMFGEKTKNKSELFPKVILLRL